ncbi:MAG: cohesin domain-containing protein [candidate division Zixibacteria bacterium]|nr:cohesin domain-containing protein [candidate division Zixibacteria bacterium]
MFNSKTKSLLLVSALFWLWTGCTKLPANGDITGNPPPPPPPDSDYVLSVTDTSASPADTGITVNVNLKNIEAVAGAQIRLTYDSTLLSMSSPPFSKPPRASQMDFFNGNFSTPGVVTFAMTWFSAKGVIPDGEGPILQLRFNVKAGALSGSQSPLDLADMGININAVSDTLGNLIIPVLTDGLFTVQ